MATINVGSTIKARDFLTRKSRHLCGFARFCGTLIALLMSLQSCNAEDFEPKETSIAFENKSSSGVPNCTLAAYILISPAERVNVSFSVDADLQWNIIFFRIMTDLVEQFHENGDPRPARMVPIDQAEFSSPEFESPGRMQAAVVDGGVQLSTSDAAVFPRVTMAFQNGHFIIRFRRQGKSMIESYAIGTSRSDVAVSSGLFRDCMTAMLIILRAK